MIKNIKTINLKVVYLEKKYYLCTQIKIYMKFAEITSNKLWAVHYDNEEMNALDRVFSQWNDTGYLLNFFRDNFEDLVSYFKITKLEDAIYDTMEDSDALECLILDIEPDANLDDLFRPLENSRISEMMLSKEKARLQNRPKHASWLRIYAIKLTRTMQEREHTLRELEKMEQIRQYLVANNVIDDDSFIDLLKEGRL